MKMRILSIGALSLALSLGAASMSAQDAGGARPVPVGVFPFTQDESMENAGRKLADLISAELSGNPSIMLVERAEIDKLVSEQSLNLSGMANPEYANKVGYLIGARIIVTGSVFKIDKETCVVAKVIGTETSRVIASKVAGPESLSGLAQKASAKISETIKSDSAALMPQYKSRKDIVDAIKRQMDGVASKPKVHVKIAERHVSAPTIDPAAETEFQSILKDLGFEVLEKEDGSDIVIKGECFSETGLRRGELIGVKARLEAKAVDKEGRIVAADRQTAVCVDVVEQMAGKEALQEAAGIMAVRLLPKIVKK